MPVRTYINKPFYIAKTLINLPGLFQSACQPADVCIIIAILRNFFYVYNLKSSLFHSLMSKKFLLTQMTALIFDALV